MKTLEELKTASNLRIVNTGIDGGCGELWRAGKPFATVIWSNGGGWEHVSICPYKRSYTPTWDEMCSLKDMFFHDNEVVVQFHPAKSEYVNNMPNCLHLWRPLNEVMPTPPSIMVGVKKGQSLTEIREEIKAIANNEKQIEEMVKDISGVSEFAILGLNNAFIKVRVACETIAERLYNAGYRKQSEGEWVDQYQGKYDNQLYKCSECGETAFHDESRWFLTHYCPNCGAKMKGGAK